MTFSNIRMRNGCRSPATPSVAFTLIALGACDCGSTFQPTPAVLADAGEGSPEAGAMVIYIAPVPEGGVTGVPLVVDAGTPDGGTMDDAATGVDAGTVEASDASADAVAVACDPTKAPKDEPCVIADAYAIFVANPTSVDAGPPDAGSAIGSMANPAPTVSQGLALAASTGKSRVYVCGGQYVESVTITSGVDLYGGFTCSAGSLAPSWQWAGATTAVTAPSRANATSFVYALSIDSPNAPVLVEDVSFSSPDAVGQDARGNGLSSIAAFVNATTVSFVRAALSAGNGASGADGGTGVRMADGTIAPSNYEPIGTPNDPSVAPAGVALVPGSITCNFVDPARLPASPDSSSGGRPSNPLVPDLGNGTSNPPPVITASTPAGQYGLGPPSSNVSEPGEDGPARSGGVASSAAGTVTASAGWTPAPGGDGPAGQPGQGGGALDGCEAPDWESGGSGGCGGAGGIGGGAGGSSIALLGVASSVSISASALRARNGGNGGAGGSGQVGQAGGPGSSGQCGPAGSGGNGAGGSGGAGGSAGISIGILYSQSGLPAFSTTDTSIAFGQPGAQGAGGEPGSGPGAEGNPGQVGYLSPQGSGPYLLAP
jgi:hypothetical protein